MKMYKLGALVALFVLAAAGMAQGGGGGGQRGGMMGGRNNSSLLGLVNRKEVQADLTLSADQTTKLQGLQTAVQDAMRARMEEMRNGGGNFDPQTMRAEMEKTNKANDKKVAEILTAEQLKRLKEIRIQTIGNQAITDAEVQKALGMTDEQVAKVKKIQEDQQAGMQQMMQDMRDGGTSREEMQAEMQKRTTKVNTDLAAVLTADQTTKLKELGGKPLKKDG